MTRLRPTAILFLVVTAVVAALTVAQAPPATATRYNWPGGWTNPAGGAQWEDWSFNSCGYVTVNGQQWAHLGNDSQGYKSGPVASIGHGTVKRVINAAAPNNGLMIEYQSTAGPFTLLYQHVNPGLSVGASVSPGSQVGTVADWPGQPGNNHVHVSLIPGPYSDSTSWYGYRNCATGAGANGGHVNPIPWLAANQPASTGNPFGSPFDVATSPANGKVRVAGWVIDPDARTTSIAVHVYVGGPVGSGTGHAIPANGSRPDVANAYPGAGDKHGFDATIDVGRGGNIPVYVYAINQGGTSGSNVLLGSRTIAVGNPSPIGNYEQVQSTGPGTITVKGWTVDPDARTQPVRLHAYVGGPAGSSSAEFHDLGFTDVPRPDVASQVGAGPRQGFLRTIVTKRVGTVPVFVYAINAPGTSGSNQLLGQRTVSVASPMPFGALDEATTPYGGRINLKGWGIDPNTPTSPTGIHVYVGGPAGTPGAEFHSFTAAAERTDVGAVHAGTGTRHGFNISLPTTLRGTQRVFAYVLNAGPGEHQLLGERTVTITEPLPLTNSARPRIVGAVEVGRTVRAAAGRWSTTGLTYRYEWKVGKRTVRGAHSNTFKIRKQYAGKRLTLVVTASRLGYESARAWAASRPVR